MDAQASVATVTVQTPPDIEWGLKKATAIGGLYNFSLGVRHNRFRTDLSYLARASVNDTLSWLLTGVVSASAEEAFMLNMYYNYVKAGFFSMWVGGGAGASSWSQTTTYMWLGSQHTYRRNGTSFIGGLYTGMSFTIADAFSFDFGLTYYHTAVLEMNSVGFKFGLRYTL